GRLLATAGAFVAAGTRPARLVPPRHWLSWGRRHGHRYRLDSRTRRRFAVHLRKLVHEFAVGLWPGHCAVPAWL
ncbi:hypothetical protein LPJ54_007310, partial [Coemansia sp. RSA 1824]